MRPLASSALGAALVLAGPVGAQATLRLTQVPSESSARAPIYVAGSFNNWNPAATQYRLTAEGDGQFMIVLPDSVHGRIEFKFTRGSWETVEQDSAGHDIPNRSFTVPPSGAALYSGTVVAWRDGRSRTPGTPTATASVSLLATHFAVPQLGRTRRIWLYLPPGYATSRRRYPVLYMQDGQNLFDAATSFAGEWGIDETLDSLHALGAPEAIVVGIDNGQRQRMDEYSPWPNARYGGGKGDAYVDFLVSTLKPYIDSHYRTLPDRLHTGVAGSSMGGLISLYAALKHPDVFGRVGAFSPSLWFSPSIYAAARRAHPEPGTRIAIVMGAQEGDTPERYVRDVHHMVDTLTAAGFTNGGEVQATIRSEGTHSERFWRREFPMVYRWLFREDADSSPVPAWTRGAVCYEVFVRSFFDSDGDGIGDLNGLIARLDYIQKLGARCIWLMPIAKSPSYHGYDVSDYYTVEPAYGTNEDFKRLMVEAHRREIKIFVDMVLNHSSSEIPWFQAALRDTTSPYRQWYRFSPTPLGKGPWGADAWHHSPVRDEYYYGVFWSGMPDLNYETPAVTEEAMKIATFWLRDMGVDGFRLDAIPYLVEEGACLTGCPGTHAILRAYGDHIRRLNPEAYTVGEAWGDIATVLPYYPDQLTSYFAFELADTLLSVVRSGVAAGLLPGFLRLQDTLPEYRWSPILSNHDGTRSMTVFGGDMSRAKLAATLLLTLPGLPFIYYGEEIGMTGDKPDPRLRTPMQWRPTSGVGFTTGTPWETPQPDSMTTSVALQDGDSGSLLNLYRRLIHLRHDHEALAAGTLVPLSASSPQVAAYIRRAGDHAVLVVANLGATAAARVSISSADSVLAGGRYRTRNLLGGPDGAALRVQRNGRVAGYVAGATLGPRQTLVLDLDRR